MRNKNIALTVLTGVVLYIGLFLLGFFISHQTPIYKGTVAPRTQQELIEFKSSLVVEGSEITKLETLSEDPLVISFEVQAPKDSLLLVGEVSYDKFPIIYLPAFLGSCLLVIISFTLIWKGE